MEVPKNLLELLSRLTAEPIASSSLAIIRNLEHLEAQRTALCEMAGRSRERSLARESELVMELSNVEAKVFKLKTSFDSSSARVCCLETVLTRFIAALTGEARDATRRAAADQSVRLDAFQQKVIVLM